MRVSSPPPPTHTLQKGNLGVLRSKKGTTVVGEPSRKKRLGLEPLGLGTTVVPVPERARGGALALP